MSVPELELPKDPEFSYMVCANGDPFRAAFAVGQSVQLVVAPNRLLFVEQEFKRLLVQALRRLRFNHLHVNASLLNKSSLFDIDWSIESLLVPFIWSYPG